MRAYERARTVALPYPRAQETALDKFGAAQGSNKTFAGYMAALVPSLPSPKVNCESRWHLPFFFFPFLAPCLESVTGNENRILACIVMSRCLRRAAGIWKIWRARSRLTAPGRWRIRPYRVKYICLK